MRAFVKFITKSAKAPPLRLGAPIAPLPSGSKGQSRITPAVLTRRETTIMARLNTNYGAMVALQNLNRTNSDLEAVQGRINSGLKVASAKDNGATYAIAQSMRGKVAGYGVAVSTVDKAMSTLDAAIAGGNA